MAVETRTPLTHALEQIKGDPLCLSIIYTLSVSFLPLSHALEPIKGVQDELFALMPGYQDGNTAAERAILKSMLQVHNAPFLIFLLFIFLLVLLPLIL